MSRTALFTISHRDLYRLFRRWGWRDGPERGDGHKRMVYRQPDGTEKTVQIMPPDRAGTGELGNSIAIKQARRIMELESIQAFLDGPESLEVTTMPAGRPRKDGRNYAGIGKAIEEWLAARPNQSIHYKEIHKAISEEFDDLPLNVVYKAMQRLTNSKRSNVGYGNSVGAYQYVQVEEKPATITPTATVPIVTYDDDKVKEQAALLEERNVPEGKVIDTVPIPRAVPANGSVPDLLSKVHVLDGGRYLMQGDDGVLYVVDSVVRLDV